MQWDRTRATTIRTLLGARGVEAAQAIEEDKMKWTYEGYWSAVFGKRNAEDVAHEYDVTPNRIAIDLWLGEAEAEAWRIGGEGKKMPPVWADHHVDAVNELKHAARSRVILAAVAEVTEPAEREALADVYAADGFGGREVHVTDQATAREMVAERLEWLRGQMAEGVR
jgi:hypothetical protein